MSTPTNSDPRIDQSAATDDSLLTAHEKLLGKQPDEKARYSLLPLNLLFFFSGLIFFGGTYLNLYSGKFDPRVFNEDGQPPTAGAASAKVDPVKMGEKLFNNAACNTCHQTNGQGLPGSFPTLVGSEWVLGSEERMVRIVLFGLQGPIKVKGADFNGPAPMPAFGNVKDSGYKWSDEKIAYVLTYVRQAWGNTAGPVTPEQVAAIRTKEGDRKAYVQDELLKLP